MSTSTRNLSLALSAVALTVLGVLVARAQAAPDGVVPVIWDREPCAHCRMHVGEPAFAAQVQLADGRVLNFDDPGCMFRWLSAHEDARRAIWLHHTREDAWIPQADVAFVEASPTPMGYGLGAVRRGEAGAISWADAEARVAARKRAKP